MVNAVSDPRGLICEAFKNAGDGPLLSILQWLIPLKTQKCSPLRIGVNFELKHLKRKKDHLKV